MRLLKFRKGAPYRTVRALLRDLQEGRWVYWLGRPRHPSIILSQQVRVAVQLVAAGVLYRCVTATRGETE